MHKAKERLAKMERRHLVAACLVVVVIAVVIVAVTVALVAHTQKQTPDTSGFSVSGEMVCLPHKDKSGPQTLECAYGLQADDNRYYGLQVDSYPMNNVQVGQRVHVKGTLTTGNDSQYDIVGTIKLESLTKP